MPTVIYQPKADEVHHHKCPDCKVDFECDYLNCRDGSQILCDDCFYQTKKLAESRKGATA